MLKSTAVFWFPGFNDPHHGLRFPLPLDSNDSLMDGGKFPTVRPFFMDVIKRVELKCGLTSNQQTIVVSGWRATNY